MTMKTLIALSFIALTYVGCDNPQRARTSTAVNGSSNYTDTGTNLGTTTSSTSTTTTTGTTTSAAVDANFPACSFTYKYSNTDLGQVAICQSTVDNTLFKFMMSTSSTSTRVCLIPTYKDASGSSTWLGQPQCTYVTAAQTYQGKLYKTRSGYTGYTLNGVMVMKETLLTEYFQCIDAYINYINTYCPLNPYNTTCVNNATIQRNYLCNAFKTKYPSNYLDLPPTGGSI